MLERYAALSGAAVVRVPWDEGPWPRDRVLSAVTDATALLAIVSPNNPTGLVASADDVRAACTAVPRACVLVDAAYAEFGGEDLTAAALAFPNTVVTRTFSKAFGLAGLRVGYAIAPPDVVSWLRAVGSPFTCGTWSRAIACDRLENGAREVDDYVQTAARERGQLFEHAFELGLRPLPSAGNFVFVRPPDPAWLRDACGGLGIAVRAFPAGVRITLPAERAAFERLLAAIEASVAPAAFLLDLDGVLADIEGRCALARPEDLEALAAIHPIGVVTSCPRRLAESILQRHGFLPHVRALVATEDGPGKPDPAPVGIALQRLGVRAAWMLGDNPADVFAARGAGVVPLAVATSPDSSERLRACGAARIVDGLPGLRELAARLPPR
jgi:phosphoglycolate phosphatase-like HAD superfamily hydrolase